MDHDLPPNAEIIINVNQEFDDQAQERFKSKKMRDEVLMLGIIHPKEPGDHRIFRDDKAKALYIFKHLNEMTWPSSLSDGEKNALTNQFDQNWEAGMYRDWLDVHTSEVLEQHRWQGP